MIVIITRCTRCTRRTPIVRRRRFEQNGRQWTYAAVDYMQRARGRHCGHLGAAGKLLWTQTRGFQQDRRRWTHCTAIVIATQYGYINVLEALLNEAKPALVNVLHRNHAGKTVFEHAIECNQKKCAQLIHACKKRFVAALDAFLCSACFRCC